VFGGQRHDQVRRLAGGPGFDGAGAGDPYGLLGVREARPAGGADGDRFDGAGFAPTMPGVAATVANRYLRPGQGLELGVQGRLVGLDRDVQVRAPVATSRAWAV
jgi:hypothetical protein